MGYPWLRGVPCQIGIARDSWAGIKTFSLVSTWATRREEERPRVPWYPPTVEQLRGLHYSFWLSRVEIHL